MRLRKIKLSGFKSFVDPTTLIVPTNLTGVVGPNGCGKSNIIDAVMWVMGESSAKHLRGDALTDVIFNGSSARNPVGQASVELMFDNTEKKLGGQYASYDEISIKRQINRESVSTYFLNGTRCRRRDITAIFLGTGLGPRSYAIIEQGMISRLIEAKPEELRTFIEEAAGISKYRERRRETENRIRNTRENIARLNDILEELDKQLKHLQRQAKAAERYQVLKKEQRQLEAEVQALNWKSLNELAGKQLEEIREHENRVEAAVSDQRTVEKEIVQHRESLTTANEDYNEVQSEYYRVGGEISRLEQKIQHINEKIQDARQGLEQINTEQQQLTEQLEQDEDQLKQLATTREGLEPQLKGSREESDKAYSWLTESEQAMQAWQTEWEEFNRTANDYSRRGEVARTRIEHLNDSLEEIRQRQMNLKQELEGMDTSDSETAIKQNDTELKSASKTRDEIEEALKHKRETLQSTRKLHQDQTGALNLQRSQCQKLEGSLASLEALQCTAMTGSNPALKKWLQKHDLVNAPRLAQRVVVETEWAGAVETVLGRFMQDICIDDSSDYLDEISQLNGGELGLIGTAEQVDAINQGRFPSLADKLKDDFPLRHLLSTVYLADDIQAAIGMRSNLTGGESVITADGFWIGQNWIRVCKSNEQQTGVINREKEIQELKFELDEAQGRLADLESAASDTLTQLESLEQEIHELQAQLNRQEQKVSELKATLTTDKAGVEQARSRSERIEDELEELLDQEQEEIQEMDTVSAELERIEFEESELQKQHIELVALKEKHQDTLRKARELWQKTHEESHGIALQLESITSQRASLEQSIKRSQIQSGHLRKRGDELENTIAENQAPVGEIKKELEEKLTQKVDSEKKLSEARSKVQNIESDLREKEQLRITHENRVQELRSGLEKARLDSQETRVRLQTIEEKLAESGQNIKDILAMLSEEAEISTWRDNLDKVSQKIHRLGPINLAAIDEFTQVSERKSYLDKQDKDLHDALKTLENAIQKIDKESRSRFKDTFDQLNANLKELFPQLFGGGMSYLELTGDDLLETGVTVMARPPGKRNSTIHLLSGGEKALTAVALVFSIFKLNPAPFCILDEVDAPLDDANVGRFSELVASMSDDIQFIFITHNKITMEIAHQLLGVTMHEAGVSRLVSVDVDEAVKMAATA